MLRVNKLLVIIIIPDPQTKWKGTVVYGLLDTGCGISVVSRQVIPDLQLKQTTQKLYAANGTEIALLGEVELTLLMSGQAVTAAVVVSEEVDDLILGIDWLGRPRCLWSFAQNLIEIHEKVLRWISRPRQNMLKRMYAVESVVVLAGHTTNVPVTMALSSLHQMTGDLAQWRHDLWELAILAARTLMRDEGWRSTVQLMNVSKEDFVLGRGEFIGEVEQVTVADNEGTAWRPSDWRGCLRGRSGGSSGKTGRETEHSREHEC